jgi:hypothetical protein
MHNSVLQSRTYSSTGERKVSLHGVEKLPHSTISKSRAANKIQVRKFIRALAHKINMTKYSTVVQRVQAQLLARQGWNNETIAAETKLSLKQVGIIFFL